MSLMTEKFPDSLKRQSTLSLYLRYCLLFKTTDFVYISLGILSWVNFGVLFFIAWSFYNNFMR